MSKPSTNWEQIGEHGCGPLIAVSFAGVYPPGSEGNEFATAMVDFLWSVVAETRPCGVVLDLTELDYQFGDAIAGLATPLRVDDKSFRPSAIVAKKETAHALELLLGPQWLMGIAGMKLVHTREEALEQIKRKLREQAGYMVAFGAFNRPLPKSSISPTAGTIGPLGQSAELLIDW